MAKHCDISLRKITIDGKQKKAYAHKSVTHTYSGQQIEKQSLSLAK